MLGHSELLCVSWTFLSVSDIQEQWTWEATQIRLSSMIQGINLAPKHFQVYNQLENLILMTYFVQKDVMTLDPKKRNKRKMTPRKKRKLSRRPCLSRASPSRASPSRASLSKASLSRTCQRSPSLTTRRLKRLTRCNFV